MLPTGSLVHVVVFHWSSVCGLVEQKVFKPVGFLSKPFGWINFGVLGWRSWFDDSWALREVDCANIVGEIGVRNLLLDN